MKFSSFSLLALCLSSVIAAPADVEKRAGGIDSLTQALAQIAHAVHGVQSAVSSYNGGVPAQIESSSSEVVKATKDAIQAAHAAGHLSENEAIQLTSPVQGLTNTIEKIVGELDSKKSQIAAVGACQETLHILEQEKSASNGLSQAVDAQLPKSLRSLSARVSSQIVTALDKAISTFQSCQNTGSSGGSTATATAATMTAAIPSSSASSAPSSPPSASGSVSAPSSSPTSAKGAASKVQVSYGLGAVAAVLAMVA